MTVVDATHGAKVETNHVYVIKPNTDRRDCRRRALGHRTARLSAPAALSRSITSSDRWRRCRGRHAVGVVLSGTGSDGTLGPRRDQGGGRPDLRAGRAVRAASGHAAERRSRAARWIWCCRPTRSRHAWPALAQHPYLATTAEAMRPVAQRHAEQFHRVITRPAQQRRASTSASIATPPSAGARRGACCSAASARRRNTRSLLERDRAEVEALYRDVLINVTSFFRDPECSTS